MSAPERIWGYCTDCDQHVPILDCGRGACGHGRIIRADLAPAAPKVKALVEAAKAVDGFMRGQNAYERSGYGPKLRAALAALEGGDA